MKEFIAKPVSSNAAEQVHSISLKATGCTQFSGLKPVSNVSPNIRVVRLSVGEGEARRKAGLIEWSESLLLLWPNGGQAVAAGWRAHCCVQPTEGEGFVIGAALLETSRT